MAKAKESEASILMWDQLCETDAWHWREYRFCPTRKWRFDFAIATGRPGGMYGIEIDGGMWIQGRHTRGSGQVKDNEKFNEAARLGWRVLRFSPQQVLKGEAIAFIMQIIRSRE